MTTAWETFSQRVKLSCTATVGGEVVTAQVAIVRAVYEDPAARKVIEDNLRRDLMLKILEKWTPVIKVRQ